MSKEASMKWSVAVAVGVAASWLGCAQPPVTVDAVSAGIWNGTPTEEWPAVGALTEGGEAFCTGTLVDPTTVLTAAHCVDDIEDAGGADLRFYTGPGAQGALPGGVEVVDVLAHPDWDGWNADIGVVFLGEACDEAPAAVNTEEMLPFQWQGLDATLVGYGITADGQDDAGQKLMTEAEIYAFDEDVFFHYTAGTNACFGDSGGPALYEFEDGWRVIGVLSMVFGHEYEDSTCVGGGGYQIRTDLYADWVAEHAAINEEPTDDDDSAGDDDDVSDDDINTDDDITADENEAGCQCREGGRAGGGFGGVLALVAVLGARRRMR